MLLEERVFFERINYTQRKINTGKVGEGEVEDTGNVVVRYRRRAERVGDRNHCRPFDTAQARDARQYIKSTSNRISTVATFIW